MDWKTKVAIGTGSAVVLASLIYVIKVQNDILKKQELIEKSFIEQKSITDSITRSQASLMTRKDLEKWAQENKIDLGPIKEDLKKLGADVNGIQTIRVYSTGYTGKEIVSTGTTPNPDPKPIDSTNPDPYGYYKNRQVLKLNEIVSGKTVPFGEVGFSAWQEKPWDISVPQRTYGIDSVIGIDENGRHVPYSDVFVEVDGTRYPLKISETKYREVLPEKEFHFYPRLFAGIDGGAYFTKTSGAASPNLQIALFNYGSTKPNPDWSFLGIGAGYEMVEKKMSFVLSPISYNVGQHLPLVDNVHVRPTVMTDTSGDFAIMAGVGFGL